LQKQWHTEYECTIFKRRKLLPATIIKHGFDKAGGFIYACIRVLRLFILKYHQPEEWAKFMSLERRLAPQIVLISEKYSKWNVGGFFRHHCYLKQPLCLIKRVYNLSHVTSVGFFVQTTETYADSNKLIHCPKGERY